MSTTAVRTKPPAAAPDIQWGMPSRLIASFSGTGGLVVKLVLLAILNAIAVWAAIILARQDKWLALVVLAAATLAIDLIYLSKRAGAVPLKFLIPGTVFLIAFELVPILYTINVAFQEYAVGHIITKGEAVQAIEENSLAQPDNGKTYVMAPAKASSGKLVLVLVEDQSGKAFIGTPEGLQPIASDKVKLDETGLITGAEGYSLLKGQELVAADTALSNYKVPTENGAAVRAEGLDTALELRPTLRYDGRAATFTRIKDGVVFKDNGEGSFVAANGEELEPGWRTYKGTANFSSIATDPLVRKPFLRVLAWTVAFATITVLASFFIGLFLAIVLDKPGLRFSRLYRGLIFVPFAMPAFLVLLIWAGLLNDDFGVVNHVSHLHVPWLFDPWWAKVSVILVGVWMSVPYFFLVSLGSLQSIPNELVEAARVDGAGPWQVFRKITLPLLLVAVTPLLIASFAFNFNDFTKIYLLTGGGPPAEDQSVAGSTDILISYTYKLAFSAGKGTDFGLAAALSIVIFVIVATISAAAFWRSRTLEEMA
jgi:arabinogalactan oligomer / maltooligosaccharide transport system permease protein